MAPSQAWSTLEMLNILEVCMPRWVLGKTLADLGLMNPQYWHLLVEAKKLAFIDLYNHNSDPRTWDAKQLLLFEKLISKEHAARLCKRVQPNGPAFTPAPTVNLTGVFPDLFTHLSISAFFPYNIFHQGFSLEGKMKRVFRLGSMPRMAYLAFQANYNRWKRRTLTEEDLVKLFERAMG